MNIKGIIKAIGHVARRAGKAVKAAAPEIAIVGGTVGLVVAGVIACKETPKAVKVIEEHKEKMEIVAKAAEDGVTAAGEEYSVEDAKHDKAMIFAQDGLQIVKTYGPAVIIAILSAASILCGSKIFRNRLTAITGAYALLEKNFSKYRDGVIDRFGKEVDKELRLGTKKELIETEEIDENGNKKTVVKEVTTTDYDGYSQYACFFDESCKQWVNDGGRNLSFLMALQRDFNNRLVAHGVVFLNDVYVALGRERTKAGQRAGWIYDPSDPKRDNYIDFGISEVVRKRTSIKQFMKNHEKSLMLDFNVDGDISDDFEKFDKLW